MFRTAVKTLSLASSTFISRAVLGSRHYCKKIPTKLRVSEAVSGLNVGANIKVQVRKKKKKQLLHTCAVFVLGFFFLTCQSQFISIFIMYLYYSY